jgi:DNA-binding NarL/FixJ family response regulator
MSELDVAQIVPSTRDLLQVLATRRKSLALVGELGEGRAAEEAARLHEVNVSAFAFAAPSSAMTDGARATKTVPSLSLAPVATREDIQRARFFGADGVCIDVALPPTEWDALAKIARGMRMLPLGLVRTTADVELAAKAGPRALVLRAETAAAVLALALQIPRSVTLVADVATEENGARVASAADAAALRALAGKVDSAVVPPSVHAAAGFEDLVAEVDP